MATHNPVNRNIVAHDFLVATHGKLDQDTIDAAIESIQADMSPYPATLTIASTVVYTTFDVRITGGKTFNGTTSGLSTPGGGMSSGEVYTNDINALYSSTVSFEFNVSLVYCGLLFFDEHNNLLGLFLTAGRSLIPSTGGGKGEWS